MSASTAVASAVEAFLDATFDLEEIPDITGFVATLTKMIPASSGKPGKTGGRARPKNVTFGDLLRCIGDAHRGELSAAMGEFEITAEQVKVELAGWAKKRSGDELAPKEATITALAGELEGTFTLEELYGLVFAEYSKSGDTNKMVLASMFWPFIREHLKSDEVKTVVFASRSESKSSSTRKSGGSTRKGRTGFHVFRLAGGETADWKAIKEDDDQTMHDAWKAMAVVLNSAVESGELSDAAEVRAYAVEHAPTAEAAARRPKMRKRK